MWQRQNWTGRRLGKSLRLLRQRYKSLPKNIMFRRGLCGPGRAGKVGRRRFNRHPKRNLQRNARNNKKRALQRCQKNKTNYMTNHLAKSSPITKKGNFAGPRLSKPVSLVAARPAGELTILEPDAANFMEVVPPAQKTFAGIKTPGLTVPMKRLFATA